MTFQAIGDKVSASAELKLDIGGLPAISVSGPDDRLSGEAYAGEQRSIPLIVSNIGSAPAAGVRLSSTPPQGWSVTFDPKALPPIPVGGQAKVNALLTPGAKAIAGDYLLTVSADGEGVSQSVSYRVTVLTSTLVGRRRHRRHSDRAPGAGRRSRQVWPAMSEPVIRAEALTKRYGAALAVDHLDLTIEKGEVFGLLGPNGAGKTTTILMLLGLTEPSSGRATVAGFDPLRQPLEVKRRVGYMPDSVGFYDNLTGLANLRYTRRAVRPQVGRSGRADRRGAGAGAARRKPGRSRCAPIRAACASASRSPRS